MTARHGKGFQVGLMRIVASLIFFLLAPALNAAVVISHGRPTTMRRVGDSQIVGYRYTFIATDTVTNERCSFEGKLDIPARSGHISIAAFKGLAVADAQRLRIRESLELCLSSKNRSVIENPFESGLNIEGDTETLP